MWRSFEFPEGFSLAERAAAVVLVPLIVETLAQDGEAVTDACHAIARRGELTVEGYRVRFLEARRMARAQRDAERALDARTARLGETIALRLETATLDGDTIELACFEVAREEAEPNGDRFGEAFRRRYREARELARREPAFRPKGFLS